MSTKELEKRIQALEDLEAIKKLKARYAQACDDHYNSAKIVKMFTEHGEFFGSTGHAKGRDAIGEYFAGQSKKIASGVHYFLQPQIEIDGNRAQGVWYMWVPMKMADGNCRLVSGFEVDKYEKVDGEWLIAETKATRFFVAAYEKGWDCT